MILKVFVFLLRPVVQAINEEMWDTDGADRREILKRVSEASQRVE